MEPGDYFAVSSRKGEFLPERVTLYVDGEKLTRDNIVIMIGADTIIEDEIGRVVARSPSIHLICWPAVLGKGLHIATIEVKKTSGEVVDYSWSFTLK